MRFSHAEKMAFRNLIDVTAKCMRERSDGTFEEDLKCEVAMFSDLNRYTYHTHPRGTPAPSELDKRTTKRFGKELLAIGLVPSREVVVFHAGDNFTKMVDRFKV